LFNQGEFHAAHELLEKAWMEVPSPERDLYQGLLQIGLAYYQISRNNYRGALKMFRRGYRNMDPLGSQMLGIDLDRLRQDARKVEEELRRLGPKRMAELGQDLFKPIPEINQP
jgi:predicted metal-dependent hydrolase